MVPADSGRFIEFWKIDIFRDFREFSKICSFTRPFRTSGEINTKFKSHPRTNETRFDWITISEIALHTWGAIKYVTAHIPHIYGSIIWIACDQKTVGTTRSDQLKALVSLEVLLVRQRLCLRWGQTSDAKVGYRGFAFWMKNDVGLIVSQPTIWCWFHQRFETVAWMNIFLKTHENHEKYRFFKIR